MATAATILYLISLQVAIERGRLEQIDRRIADAKHDIRQLQTELGTRASLRQLERWNVDELALSAPQAKQFLANESGLATAGHSGLGNEVPPPLAVMVAAEIPEAIKVAPDSGDTEAPNQAPPVTLTKQDRALQRAIAPKKPKLDRVASLDTDLAQRASSDGSQSKGKARP
ncbi:MAG: hypothetical protein ACKVOJ_00975 [Sphingomonadaceae bacterium]